MILRRLAGLGTALLLLRLNFVAVDSACAEHELAGAAATASTGAHEHHAATPSAPHETAADASDSCQVPLRSDCCEALASCASALGACSALRSSGAIQLAVRVAASTVDAPISHSDAPDPPPPKS